MLTIAEYQQAAKQADRRFGWHFAAWNLVGVAYIAIPAVTYVSIFGRMRDEHVDWAIQRVGPNGVIALLVVWFVPAGVFMFRSVWRMDERMAARDPRLRCAKCGRPLSTSPWIIAIRRCGHCKSQVLSDPVPSGMFNHELPTREQFTSITKELVEAFLPWRYVICCLIGGALTIASLATDLPMVIVLLSFFFSGFSIVIGLLSPIRIFRKYHWLRCQGCQKPMLELPRIVEQSGNCPNCGRRVLADQDRAITVAGSGSASSR